MDRTFESQLKKQALNDILTFIQGGKKDITGTIIFNKNNQSFYWWDKNNLYQITINFNDVIKNSIITAAYY